MTNIPQKFSISKKLRLSWKLSKRNEFKTVSKTKATVID